MLPLSPWRIGLSESIKPSTYSPSLSCQWQYCKLSEKTLHLTNHLLFVVLQAHECPSHSFPLLVLPSLRFLLVLSFHSGFSVLDHWLSWDPSFLWLSLIPQVLDMDLCPPGDSASLLVSLPCVHVVLVSFLLFVCMVSLPHVFVLTLH